MSGQGEREEDFVCGERLTTNEKGNDKLFLCI